MKRFNILHTIVFVLFSTLPGFAQEVPITLTWKEEEEAFYTGNLHRIKCEITTPSDQLVKLVVKPDAPLKLLSPSTYKIVAKAGEIKTSSIKLYLPQTEMEGKDSLSCEVYVQTLTGQTILGKARLSFEIKERLSIRLDPQRIQIPLNASDSFALVPIRVRNLGKISYEVRVALQQKPPGLKVDNRTMDFLLKPKADTLLNFVIQPDKNWNKTHLAKMKFILTLQKNGKKASDCEVTAFPLIHSKKYHYPDEAFNNIHEFGLETQVRGHGQNMLDISAKGISPLSKGLINYQLQSFHYSGSDEINFSNSYVSYRQKKQSLTVGHVNYNDEISLFGRGITYDVGTDSQSVHLGFVNGIYELLHPSFAIAPNISNSFFGGYEKIFPRMGFFQANGALQLGTQSNSGLFWATNTLSKEKTLLRFRVGLSGEQNKIQQENFNNRLGAVLIGEYEKETQDWSLRSSSRYSTLGYSGNFPGMLYSRNNFDFFGLDPIIIKTSVRYEQSRSVELKHNEMYSRQGNIFMYQVQFENAQSGKWKFKVIPSQTFDRRNFVDITQLEKIYTANTSRVKLEMSRKHRGVSVLWNGDIGSFSFARESEKQNQYLFYRVGFSMSMINFSFNTYYSQRSPLLSAAIEQALSGNDFSNFLMNVNWGKWLFHSKLKLNISNQLNYDNFRKRWTNSCAFRVKTNLPQNLTLDTEFVYFKSNNYNDFFCNIRLVKKIGNYRPPSGGKKMKLFLYEDINSNGNPENNEPPLEGMLVQIDQVPLLTNKDGWILYKSVPAGEYRISVTDPTGKLAGSKQVVNLNKNAEIQIPLFKTISLTGVVKEIKVRFKSSKFELVGIPVIAKNEAGETFITYTQPDGSFAFNLPENEYIVYIDIDAFGKNFEFPDNFQKAVLTQNEQPEISLSVKVKSRNMNIQKF